MPLISPDLSLFITVAETKGFSAAARTFGLTPKYGPAQTGSDFMSAETRKF